VHGAQPQALGFGDGAQLRRPHGLAIVGGRIARPLQTLLTTPVVYLALDRFRRKTGHEQLLARHGDARPSQGAPA
jgi:multidrug efflux pump